jgi:hypothetical protein
MPVTSVRVVDGIGDGDRGGDGAGDRGGDGAGDRDGAGGGDGTGDSAGAASACGLTFSAEHASAHTATIPSSLRR